MLRIVIVQLHRQSQKSCALLQQLFVTQHHKRNGVRLFRQLQTQVCTYAGRFAGGNCQKRGTSIH